MASLTITMDAGEVFVYVDRINSTYRLTLDDDSGTSLVLTGTHNQIETVRDKIFSKLADAKYLNQI